LNVPLANFREPPRRESMHTASTIDIVVIRPVVALVIGILILIIPRALNYLVALYLIFIGLVDLWPRLFGHPIF
jgi:hypothetical protein